MHGALWRAEFTTDGTDSREIYNGDTFAANATVGTGAAGAIAAGGSFGTDYFFADGAGGVQKYDTTGGVGFTDLGSLGTNVNTQYGDLVALDATTLVLSVRFVDNGTSTDQLVRYDTTNGNVDVYDNIDRRFAGLAFGDQGSLFGIRSNTPSDSNNRGVYLIDLAANAGEGSYDFIADYSESRTFTDAAAVPIPAAAWLFGSALIGAIGLGRRKSKRAAQA